MIFYILSEIFLFILIFVSKLFIQNQNLLDFITLMPIVITSIYLLVNKNKIANVNKMLFYGIILLVLGDLSFVTHHEVFGILFFLILQSIYFTYLDDKVNKKIVWFILFINGCLCFLFRDKFLNIEALLYGLVTLVNTIKAIKLIKSKKLELFLFISFIFLLLCDVNLFICILVKGFKVLEKIFFIIEWFFYILFQIFITIFLLKKKISKF